MTAPRHGHAAGTKHGPAPLATTFFTPDFARLDAIELATLLNVLRDPLATHLYLVLRTGADFRSGEVLTSYARLMELMRPPQMERAARRPGPTYKQVRTAVDLLVSVDFVHRAPTNEAQGQLRLYVQLPHLVRPVAANQKIRPSVRK